MKFHQLHTHICSVTVYIILSVLALKQGLELVCPGEGTLGDHHGQDKFLHLFFLSPAHGFQVRHSHMVMEMG